MPFVTAGYSQYSATDEGEDFDFDGYNIGVGLDYALSTNLIATVGLTYRDTTYEIEGLEDASAELDLGTTTLGVSLSYKF